MMMRAIRAEKAKREAERERERVAKDAERIRERSKTLAGFTREAWHVLEPSTPYIHGWHIDAICMHLEAITTGKFLALGLPNRLLINVPPGTMKSLLTSVIWPAWEWGPMGMPGLRYLTTSYAEKYVKRDSRRMRNLIQSEWYQTLWPEVRLTRSGEISFENTKAGSREGVTFNSLTGGRGDREIIDDPHSTETAESDAERETAIRIFRESVPSRINDPVKSAIVVIMQRLHQDDISGQIEKLGLDYVHLMLPMEFEPDRRCETPLGFVDPRTYDGELLAPERFTRETLARDQKSLTEYAIAGQYQQRPVPRGGGLFKREDFGFIKSIPAGTVFVRGWDFAATEGGASARTAAVKIGKMPDGRFVVASSIAEAYGPAKVRKLLKSTAELDGKSCWISIPKDPAQAGKEQAQSRVALLSGYRVEATPETGSKVTRAEPLSAQVEAGNVVLLEAEWNQPFLDEICSFPHGRRADIPDAASRAFNKLTSLNTSAFKVPFDKMICEPFAIPSHWPRTFVIGVEPDALVALWGAWDETGNCTAFGEYQSDRASAAIDANALLARGSWLTGELVAGDRMNADDIKGFRSAMRAHKLIARPVRKDGSTAFAATRQALELNQVKVFRNLSGLADEYEGFTEPEDGKQMKPSLMMKTFMALIAGGKTSGKVQQDDPLSTFSAPSVRSTAGY